MTKEALKIKLTELFPTTVFDETGEWLNMTVTVNDFLDDMEIIRSNAELNFDYMFCLTCVDWKTHLTMVYHLSSTIHRETIVVKARLDRTAPQIETVSDIWRTAEFHEREVYELFGVAFLHHPDLRRLILTDDFEGFPLRKDFEDPVNMIKL